MKNLLYILFWIFTLSFSACHDDVSISSALLQAEALMGAHPDSALTILDSIPFPEKQSKEDYATWCLLITEAWDKNYVEHTSDSIINVAVGYFEKGKDVRRKAQTYYYGGRVLHEIEQDDKALKYYLRALTNGEKVKENKLCGMICRQIAQLYRLQFLEKEALPYYNRSYSYFGQAADTVGCVFALRDIGRVYAEMKPAKPDSAIFYYKQVYDAAKKMDHQSLLSSVLNDMGCEYKQIKDFSSAKKSITQSIELTSDKPQLQFSKYLNIGDLYLQTSDWDSARYYLQKSVQSLDMNTKAGSFLALSKLEVAVGHYKEANGYKDSLSVYKDAISALIYSSQLLKIEKQYNVDKSVLQIQAEELKKRIFLTILAGTLLILLLIVIGVYQKRQHRRMLLFFQKEQDISRLEALLQIMGGQKNENRTQMELLKQKKEDLQQKYHSLLQASRAYAENIQKLNKDLNKMTELSEELEQSTQEIQHLLDENERLSVTSAEFAKNAQQVIDSQEKITEISKQLEQINQKNQNLQLQNEKHLAERAEFLENSQKLHEYQSEIAELTRQLEQIAQSSTNTDTIQSRIEQIQSVLLNQSNIYIKIAPYIRKLRKDKRDENMKFEYAQWQYFIKVIDLAFNNFLTQLENQYKLDMDDLVTIALIRLEINPTHMQIVLNQNTPSLITRRKKKVADKLNIKLAELDDFISVF